MTMPARLLRLLAGFGLLAALLGGLWAAYRSARPAPLAMPKLPAPSAT